MENFIWSGNVEKKKLVIVAWKKWCENLEEGGFGIIFLHHYNTVTNLHLCWQLINNTQSLTSLLAPRVRRNNKNIGYFIKLSLWRGIKDFYNKVMDESVWIIGNGRKINFWSDNWAGETLAFKYKIPDKFHSGLS